MQQEIEKLKADSKISTPSYDLNSIEGINSIPVESFEYDPNDGKQYAFNNIEYVLQRKATEHKKNGRMDLAIACLRKSNQIMPLSSMMYTQDDYMRLVKYLRLDKQFEAADIEEEEILGEKSKVTNKAIHDQVLKKQIQSAKSMGTDLVSAVCNCYHCEECAKYINRVYSISGKDKRFPKLPDYVVENSQHCGIMMYPFVYGVNTMRDVYTGKSIIESEIIAYSNRPYIDDRPQEWKVGYQKLEAEANNKKNCEYEYKLICQKLPDIAPKNQGGYLRMKKSNSENFQKLKEKAISAGIEIKDLIS
ncbi:MAG: hypothetical protein J6C96_11865 [Oscillospiraceae bacterium]|nr:hypothetical protein [Oscillospiraceae bacterium]